MRKALLKNNQIAEFDDKTKTVAITGKCTCTGKDHSVTISYDNYQKYFIDGVHVQFAMSNVKPEDREFLMTGISPEGWKELFGTNN